MVALLVLLAVLVFLTVDYFVQRRHQVVTAAAKSPGLAPLVMHDPNYRIPQGVYFDHGHAWAFLEESGDALVGVDDLVRTIMGRIERIEVAPAGTKVKKGDRLIELFHGDRSIVVESPFDGVVAGANKAIAGDDESRPFISDWLCAVRPNDTSLLAQVMLLGKNASEWLKREARRLRVFLATIAPEHPVLAQTMRDGGMPYSGLVEYLGDDEWNKLRESFFHHRENVAS